jgi:hypothetical protein
VSLLIGPADDFYRLRVRRLDLGGDVEFDWRDDVLWRSVATAATSEADTWVIEALTLDAREAVTPIASFANADDARISLDSIVEDLRAMNKSEFEAEYIAPRTPER